MLDLHFILLLTLVALASARVAVLLVHDVILDKPRDWFFRQFPPYNNPMLGYNYQSLSKQGVEIPASLTRKAYLFSELLTCTRCLTVWTSVPIYFAAKEWDWAYEATAIVAVMAVACWVAKKL